MPRIIADLNGLQHYAWVATAYLLASTASMPIWGKLSDAYGRKRFFIVGMVIFVVGSALCGQANGMTELIVFRAFQGLGAGAMMPITQAIIGDIFPPAQRAKWTGVLMSVFAVATIIGPLLGGWITDNVGWRWVFYVNLPVGIVALVVAVVALPGHVTVHKHRIDYSGAALLVAAAVPLLLGFSWAGSEYAVGLLADRRPVRLLGRRCGVAFFFRELRAAEPVINPRLFENRIFTVSALASALQSAAMFGAIMFLPLFVQGVQGKSATNSGIILMPLMLGAMVTSIGAGQILARTGRYKVLVICGFVTVTGGACSSRAWASTRAGRVLARNMVDHGARPRHRHERLHGDRPEPVPDATVWARSPPACSSSARSAHRRPGRLRHHPEQPVRRAHEAEPAGAAGAGTWRGAAPRSTTRRCCCRSQARAAAAARVRAVRRPGREAVRGVHGRGAAEPVERDQRPVPARRDRRRRSGWSSCCSCARTRCARRT